MQVVGGDGSMPAQPEPRLMLAAFNQQTAGSHVYSFVPRRLVVFGEELRREQLDYVDWNWLGLGLRLGLGPPAGGRRVRLLGLLLGLGRCGGGAGGLDPPQPAELREVLPPG